MVYSHSHYKCWWNSYSFSSIVINSTLRKKRYWNITEIGIIHFCKNTIATYLYTKKKDTYQDVNGIYLWAEGVLDDIFYFVCARFLKTHICNEHMLLNNQTVIALDESGQMKIIFP